MSADGGGGLRWGRVLPDPHSKQGERRGGPQGWEGGRGHSLGLGVRTQPLPHAHHLLQDVVGEEAVLDVGHLHVHGDAVVVGPLLDERGVGSLLGSFLGSFLGSPTQHCIGTALRRGWGLLTSGGGITQKGAILDSTPGLPA